MKTPEEIKNGLACCRNVWVDDHWKNCDGACPYQEEQSYCKNVLHHDALAYIKQLEAKDPQWISFKERLPEAGARVLVAVGAVFEAYIDDAGVWQRYYSSPMKDVLGEPTHWMPLPPSPEEVK